MLRRSHILTAAALLAVCATPASAATYEDLSRTAPPAATLVRPRPRSRPRPPTTTRTCAARHRRRGRAPRPARGRPRSVCAQPGVRLARRGRRRAGPAVRAGRHCRARSLHRLGAQAGRVGRGAGDGAQRHPRRTCDTHGRRGPGASGGFDWTDAGIGAAGMLALFSIAAGSALVLTGRRHRRGVGVATR